MEELAVIGGGAYAAVFVNLLTERLAGTGRMPRITVFDASRRPWTGEAFQEDTAPGLTNSPAGWMSASAADPLHYVRWLQERHHDNGQEPVTVDTVVPRPVYGRYLREVAARAAARAAAEGGGLRRVREEITGVAGEPGALRLTGATGGHGPFGKVLVCVGPGERPDPYGLSGTPGYLASPYPLGRMLERVPRAAPVLVAGSGLTAVDVALALLARHPEGPVTMVSRGGLLPMPRMPLGAPPPLVHLTRARVDAALAEGEGTPLSRMTALVDAELREHGTELAAVLPDLVPSGDAAARLRKALESPQGEPWRAALTHGAADHFAYVYSHLAEAERRVVVEEMHPYIRNFGVPIPRCSAERLLAALDSGALRVLPGLSALKRTSGGFVARTAAGESAAPVVVNATSAPVERWRGGTRALLEAFAAAGHARAAAYGGLQADPYGRLLDATGVPQPGLAALGPVTRGSHYLIDAVVLTVRQAGRLLDRWYGPQAGA